MAELTDIRTRHITLMHRTGDILGHILKHVTQEQATTLRDGPEGWTILEVVCHLRDFDGIFRSRAQMMLDTDYPALPAYDHEAMAIDRAYNEEDLAYAYDEFLIARRQTITFFEALTDEQWERTAVHPERGHFSMTDAVIQVGHHDVNHLEQLTRTFTQAIAEADSLPTETVEEEEDEE